VSKPQTHRLFFALNPDDRVRSRVQQLQNRLDAGGRAVPAPNFHVTLAFLGMQQPDVIPPVREIASQLTFEPCRLTLDSIGHFRQAGVLWLGAEQVPPELQKFQHALVDRLLRAEIGYDRKPWKFHLTLYRKMRKRPPIIEPVNIEWTLNGFSLIESVSVNRGVEYHSIGHWEAESRAGYQ